MPIDYSKFDNIEISDDEDIEVHPNIDKASFIRWKQRDIHQKRQERRDRIEQLKANINLNGRLDTLVKGLLDKEATTQDKSTELMKEYRALKDKSGSEGGVGLEEMIAQLLEQVDKQPNKRPGWLKEAIQVKRKELQAVNQKEKEELTKLEKEASKVITVDGVKVSKETTRINRSDKKEEPMAGTSKAKTTTVDVLNPGSAYKHMEQDNNEFIKTPNALYYSHMDSFEKSYECLRKHPQLISDEVADELLAEAFSAQMDHRPHRSEQLIRQALVLQYIVQVGKHKMPLFFEKMSSPQGQARRAFADDVAFKYNHVKTRCLAIAKERKEEAARQQQQATIIEQKRAEMDMETEEASQQAMVIQVPEDADENGRKRAEAFNSFPPKFQRALLGNELDKVNEALQELESDEQERILQLCRETGLLDIAEEEELID